MADYVIPTYTDKRLRYFYGLFLQDQDFIDEQKYHIGRQRRHATGLHLSGIVQGLAVSIDNSKLTVTVGSALDDLGREIVLSERRTVEIPAELYGKAAYLIARYDEIETQPRDSNVAATGGAASEPSFFQEKPDILLIEQSVLAANPHTVILAAITIGAGGTLTTTSVDNGVRVYSGINLPGSGTNDTWPSMRWKAPNLSLLKGSLEVDGDLSVGAVAAGVASSSTDFGYGKRLLFNGNKENTDQLWIARYNEASDKSRLRINIGDNTAGDDMLEVGVTSGTAWNSLMCVRNNGKIGIKNDQPGADFDVNGNVHINTSDQHLLLDRNVTTGGNALLLELRQLDSNPPTIPEVRHCIRFHHGYRYWHRLEAQLSGFHTKTGDLTKDDYVPLHTGNLNVNGNLDVNGCSALGYESSISDFGAALKSGFYQGSGTITGNVPDESPGWSHLLTIRHSNIENNHQLQIGASYAENDRLFFRKIAGGVAESRNTIWNEVATRGENVFSGNQVIDGILELKNALKIDGQVVIDDNGGWHRSYGNTGWYNGTHGGGWYMEDSTWIKTYNNKSLWVGGNGLINGTLSVSGAGIYNNNNLRIFQTNASDWLRINPDSTFPAIALYMSTAIGNGGLAVGDWTQQPAGRLKITENIYVGGNGVFNGTLELKNALIIDGQTVIDDNGGWHRSYGATGWYNGTYGGGWYMQDSTWIRSYNNKSIYHNAGILRTDGTFQVGDNGGRFIVNESGNVGIGINEPKAKLHIGGDLYLSLASANDRHVSINGADFYIGWNWSGGKGETVFFQHGANGWKGGFDFYSIRDAQGLRHIASIEDTGDLKILGGVGKLSDERFKTNIRPISNSLEKVERLNGIYFNWNEKKLIDGKTHTGLVAQDVLKVIPEVVDFGLKGDTEEEPYCVYYEGLIPVLIEAIKELNVKIDKLQTLRR